MNQPLARQYTDDFGQVTEINFSGRSGAGYGPLDAVELPESQAALRQFSLERMMAYGVHYADALELRGRVWSGERWQAVATELAQTCLHPPEYAISPETKRTRANRIFRSSALWRMSQAMMLDDSSERTGIYVKAAELYEEASEVAGDRQRVTLETENGPLVGWLHTSALPHTVGRIIVLGGIEGWAMDCAETGVELAARGIEVFAIDGPGHGETRMVHHHYLTTDWERSYAAAIDFLAARGAEPIGIIGLSMGGSLATHLAARDARISACINNGGFAVPYMLRYMGGAGAANKGSTFFRKVAAHCGNVSHDDAEAIWRTINPIDPDHRVECPYLIVHSQIDPLVTTDDVTKLLDAARSTDKKLVVFSDGLHCIYNHPDDKYNLIGDWLASRLGRR